MLLYAFVKFAAYALWCALGLYLLAGPARLADTLKFGAVRWVLGLAFGLAAAMSIGSVARQSVTALYFGVYTPLRVIEWSIMLFLIARGAPAPRVAIRDPVAWLWVAGGIVVSFGSDLTSPEGMAGRFCVGRCLC